MTVFLDGPRMPPARGGKPDALVILLHGYGSNGADLISLAPYWAKALPGAAFVSPNAIEPVPQAPGGYQWFPISNLDPHLMEQGARAAAQSVDRFIDRELEKYGLDAGRLALVGFSQGTMMALHVGLRREKQIAGVLGYSGVLVGARTLKEQMRSKPPDPAHPRRPRSHHSDPGHVRLGRGAGGLRARRAVAHFLRRAALDRPGRARTGRGISRHALENAARLSSAR